MPVCDRLQLVDPSGRSEHVDDDDGGGAGRDLRLDIDGIEVEGLVDLGKDRRRAGIDDRGDRRDVRETGNDHLVAGPDAEAQERDPECGRAAAVKGQPVADTRELGDRPLDRVHLRAERGVV